MHSPARRQRSSRVSGGGVRGARAPRARSRLAQAAQRWGRGGAHKPRGTCVAVVARRLNGDAAALAIAADTTAQGRGV